MIELATEFRRQDKRRDAELEIVPERCAGK